MTKIVDTGEILCGFGVRKNYEGQKDFDQTYKEVTIKKRIKKIGDGEYDYIEEEFAEVKEIPIKEVLAAQVDSVGIEAYMRPYIMAGQELPGVHVSDNIQDFSQFPEDPADALRVGDNMMKAFAGLDPALRGDASSVEQFLNGLSQEKIDAYIASKIAALNVDKKEVNENDK